MTARPKQNAVRSLPYQRIVRAMACIRCGVVGFTQFCHSDEGKGMGIKSDDRTGWPGCGPHWAGRHLLPGCHFVVGTSGQFSQEQRRELEAEYAAETRAEIEAAGMWPKNLPRMDA